MKNWRTALAICAIFATLLASCATSGAYWIPPSSPHTQSPESAILPQGTAQASPTSPTSTPQEPAETALDPPEQTPEVTTPVAEDTFLPPTFPPPTNTPEVSLVNSAPILYYAQAADTLPVVAVRFGVQPEEITSPDPIPPREFISPGQLLIIPRRLTNTTTSQKLMPDSEVVYSPSAVNFDSLAFAAEAGGYLSTFSEWHKSTGLKSGAEIVERVAIENSINPRLLLALLEWHSQWVFGQPASTDKARYPLGVIDPREKGLYNQLVWTVNQLSIGYYAYREGRLTEIRFQDGTKTRLAPDLNAGTAALQYYFAQIYDSEAWLRALDTETGFPALHHMMFGNPWARAQTVEPLFPPGIRQPPLILPFVRNWTWSLTGGPHGAWEHDGAYAALDFAPGTTSPGCVQSDTWVLAAADGLVVRTGPGLVVLDLDGDGYEQTGWVLVYLHVEQRDRVKEGEWVATGDKIGHASCEGGYATGTHLHIARKYNGEWVPADGPLPFNLGGWVAHGGESAYLGTLTRDGEVVTACVCSDANSFIIRTDDDP